MIKLKKANQRRVLGGKNMLRVYIAGAYSADNVLGVLNNMRVGMRAGTKVLLAGFSPFVPWLDYHFQLMLRENEELEVEDYYRYSLAWLEVSEVVLVLPNSGKSKGTQAEIERAKELGIPIVYSMIGLHHAAKKHMMERIKKEKQRG
jgi:hypothetical protein